MKKKALIVGLEYPGSSQELDGCLADALLMKKTIMDENVYDFKEEDIIILEDRTEKNKDKYLGSRNNIIKTFNNIIDSEPDFFFFYSACHGIRSYDRNKDEKLYGINSKKINYYNGTGKDSCIITSEKYSSNEIRDDEFKIIMNKFKPTTSILAILDCCHSGTMLDLPYINLIKKANTSNKFRNRYYCIPSKFTSNNIGPNAICISGARDKQYSYESNKNGISHGHFTYSVCNLMRKYELDKISIETFVLLVTNKLNNIKQIPVITSSYPLDIKKCYFIDDTKKLRLEKINDTEFLEKDGKPIVSEPKSFYDSLFNILDRNINDRDYFKNNK